MKKNNFSKIILSLGLISAVVSTNLFALNTNQKQNKISFEKVMKEINKIKGYGLYPINNSEKKQIEKVTKLPSSMITFYGKKKGVKGLIEYVLQVRGKPLILYKNLKKNYYIAGYIIDSNGTNLSMEDAKKTFKRISQRQYGSFFKEIKQKAPNFVIPIKGKGPKNKIAVIYTDPQCPFCKNFEERLSGLEYLAKNYGKIYVVEYPLPFHKEAKQRAFWIINNIKNAKSMEEKIKIIKEGSTKNYNDIVAENKKNNVDYNNELKKLRSIETPSYFGTPSITNEKGEDIRGEVMKNIFIQKFHLKNNQVKVN